MVKINKKMIDNAVAHAIPEEIINDAHWEIQYAKFFHLPLSISSPNCPFLRPMIPSRRSRLKRTWLSSSSTNVSLHILCCKLSEPTLVVSLHENICEEHYISKLNFTWPQGSYDSECSLQGSKVIFASYRDDMGQIQKFALRFPSSTESQKFMSSLKCLKEGTNWSNGMPLCVFTEEIEEEYGPLCRPSINQEHGPHSRSEQGVRGHAVGGTDVALPQSFTALLADCCSEADRGVPQAPTEVDQNQFSRVKRMEDNFLDMMDYMDTVIIGLGGDLAI